MSKFYLTEADLKATAYEKMVKELGQEKVDIILSNGKFRHGRKYIWVTGEKCELKYVGVMNKDGEFDFFLPEEFDPDPVRIQINTLLMKIPTRPRSLQERNRQSMLKSALSDLREIRDGGCVRGNGISNRAFSEVTE